MDRTEEEEMKKAKRRITLNKSNEEFALRIAGSVLFNHPIAKFNNRLWQGRMDIVKAAKKSLRKAAR